MPEPTLTLRDAVIARGGKLCLTNCKATDGGTVVVVANWETAQVTEDIAVFSLQEITAIASENNENQKLLIKEMYQEKMAAGCNQEEYPHTDPRPDLGQSIMWMRLFKSASPNLKSILLVGRAIGLKLGYKQEKGTWALEPVGFKDNYSYTQYRELLIPYASETVRLLSSIPKPKSGIH